MKKVKLKSFLKELFSSSIIYDFIASIVLFIIILNATNTGLIIVCLFLAGYTVRGVLTFKRVRNEYEELERRVDKCKKEVKKLEEDE